MIASLLLSFILYLVFDTFWLKFSAPSYNKVVQNIQNQDVSIGRTYIPNVLIYALLAIGMALLVLPTNKPLNSVLYGLIIYGVLNLTNLMYFTNWSWNVAIIDTLWGVFLNFMVYTILKFFL